MGIWPSGRRWRVGGGWSQRVPAVRVWCATAWPDDTLLGSVAVFRVRALFERFGCFEDASLDAGIERLGWVSGSWPSVRSTLLRHDAGDDAESASPASQSGQHSGESRSRHAQFFAASLSGHSSGLAALRTLARTPGKSASISSRRSVFTTSVPRRSDATSPASRKI